MKFSVCWNQNIAHTCDNESALREKLSESVSLGWSKKKGYFFNNRMRGKNRLPFDNSLEGQSMVESTNTSSFIYDTEPTKKIENVLHIAII